jgi:DNA-binding FadR family transcriptional regulator
MAQITRKVHPSDPTGALVVGAPQSRAEQLADAIAASITERGLGSGAALGTLESIRAETGVARTTVSEAVRLLRDRGVLTIKPGRGGGLFVAEETPVVRLRHTLMAVQGDPSSIADAIEVREELESLIALRACAHRSDGDIAAMREHLALMREADSWDDFMHANWALHRRIAAICPNSLARAVYEATLGYLSAGVARTDDTVVDEDYRAVRLGVHEELVAAIAAADPDRTAAAVERHAGSG